MQRHPPTRGSNENKAQIITNKDVDFSIQMLSLKFHIAYIFNITVFDLISAVVILTYMSSISITYRRRRACPFIWELFFFFLSILK